jgi:hypothetical protein
MTTANWITLAAIAACTVAFTLWAFRKRAKKPDGRFKTNAQYAKEKAEKESDIIP